MRFYFIRDELPLMRALRGLELLNDGQFNIIGQVLSIFDNRNWRYWQALT
jgi:hypothetical protein